MPYPRVPELSVDQGRLYTAQQSRELDRLAIAQGTPGFELMKQAARAAYRVLRKHWPDAQQLAICCGGGNNGGDGLVMAALALEHQQQVSVYLVGGEETVAKLRGEAKQAYDMAVAQGVVIESFMPQTQMTADVVVDALLGTGLQSEVRGDFVEAITAINHARSTDQVGGVLAVDIPSGLCSDRGRVLGCAVYADVTTTLIGLKKGLVTHEGVACSGALYFTALDVAAEVYQQVPTTVSLVTPDWVRQQLRPRPRTAHKGDFGHVLVVGGDDGMAGAVLMASDAALRAGAGLVSLATRSDHVGSANARCPEVMAHGVNNPHQLKALLPRASVILIGPGLGHSAWSTQMLQAVQHWAQQTGTPVVWDADALNQLTANQRLLATLTGRHVFTPHPGEAARLLSMTTAEVQADRYQAATCLQQHYGGVMVLKGSGTLVTDGRQTKVCRRGNPGMASGGMGDVLAGMIAGLIAQQPDMTPQALMTAACVAVDSHAAAADACAVKRGERGLRATDLLAELGPLMNPG